MEPEPYSESQAEPQSEPDMESLLAKHLEEQAQCVAKRGDVRLGRIIEISEATAKTMDALTKINMPAGVNIRIKI